MVRNMKHKIPHKGESIYSHNILIHSVGLAETVGDDGESLRDGFWDFQYARDHRAENTVDVFLSLIFTHKSRQISFHEQKTILFFFLIFIFNLNGFLHQPSTLLLKETIEKQKKTISKN